MSKKIKLLEIGTKFGRLTVIGIEKRFDKNGNQMHYYNCHCDCGNDKTVYHYNLIKGFTQSCGCLQKERVRTSNKKYNNYDLSGEYGVGYTSNTKKEFYFDLEDYDLIKDYCWKENPPTNNNKNGYLNSTYKSVSIHGIVMHKENYRKEKYKNDFVIDHIDGNVLNNRKQNLRICTNQQNLMNCKLSSNNTTGYTGISYDKKYNKWDAHIMIDRKNIHLGRFANIEDATKARLKAEEEYFGEYSRNYYNTTKGGQLN